MSQPNVFPDAFFPFEYWPLEYWPLSNVTVTADVHGCVVVTDTSIYGVTITDISIYGVVITHSGYYDVALIDEVCPS